MTHRLWDFMKSFLSEIWGNHSRKPFTTEAIDHRWWLIKPKLFVLPPFFLSGLFLGRVSLIDCRAKKWSQLRKRRTEAWNYFQNRPPFKWVSIKREIVKPLLPHNQRGLREQWIHSRERDYFLFDITGFTIDFSIIRVPLDSYTQRI